MTTQDKIFWDNEGDIWFERNKEALDKGGKFDWPLHCLSLIDGKDKIRSVIELGCSNGYRLASLQTRLKEARRFVGIDASAKAIADGQRQYPKVEFIRGTLADLPVHEEFDLVIVNFVLHWVDRKTLARSIAEIDQVTAEGGILILGDFLPDFQQRCPYHHLKDKKVFTYKQDYSKIFEALGLYREFFRIGFDHDKCRSLSPATSSSRAVCVALKKQILDYYPEMS